MHFQHVTQDCPPLLLRYFIAMSSIEPARREETEHDKSARRLSKNSSFFAVSPC